MALPIAVTMPKLTVRGIWWLLQVDVVGFRALPLTIQRNNFVATHPCLLVGSLPIAGSHPSGSSSLGWQEWHGPEWRGWGWRPTCVS